MEFINKSAVISKGKPVLREYRYDISEFNLQRVEEDHKAKVYLLMNLLFKSKGGLPDPDAGVDLNAKRHMIITSGNVSNLQTTITTQINTYLPNMFKDVVVKISESYPEALEFEIYIASSAYKVISSDEMLDVFNLKSDKS